MLRKTAVFLAAICMLFSLVACGNKDTTSNSGNGSRNGEPYQSKNQDSYNDGGMINDTIDGIENGVNDTISGIENGVNDTLSGIENGMNSGNNNGMR